MIDTRLYDKPPEPSEIQLPHGLDAPQSACFGFVLNHDKPNTNPNQRGTNSMFSLTTSLQVHGMLTAARFLLLELHVSEHY